MQLMPTTELKQAVNQYLLNSTYINEFPPEGPAGIALQEGCSSTAYKDTRGRWTIGIGHTPAYPGEVWSNETIMSIFFNDIYSKGYLPVNQQLPWVAQLSPQRKWVNYNASFNMGIGSWSMFDQTFQSMQNGNLLGVLEGMMNSPWYRTQDPNRVRALMYQYYFDQWVIGYLTPKQNNILNNVINDLGMPFQPNPVSV